MNVKDINTVLGQLKYEISILGIDKREMKGVSNRMDKLTEILKQSEDVVLDSVSGSSEIYCMYDRSDSEIFCAFDDKERAELEHEECGAPYQVVKLHHGKRE